MTIRENSSLAQIVLDHPECARVLRRHRLDFCCRGDLTLSAACAAKRVDVATLTKDLDAAIAEETARGVAVDVRALSTPELVAYIVEHHHGYLRRSLPHAVELARKVARVHGDNHPKLPALADVVVELRETLEPHLDEEEEDTFPHLSDPAQLRSMLADHLRVGELLTTMRTLADDYAVPAGACRSYRALLDVLDEIERHTLEHVHIENHVLAARLREARS